MDVLHVPVWVWAATIAALAVLLGADLAVSAHRTRPVRPPEAALWTVATIALAVGFGAALAATAGGATAGQFYAGWLTEYSLSLDNLFVFVLLIGGSAAPARLHGRVLLLGILFALVLRAVFIGMGAAALHQFGWAGYFFGAFLLYTAARMVLRRAPHAPDGDANGTQGGTVERTARRMLRVAPHYDGPRLTTRVAGRLRATPLLVLALAIGAADVMFAVDSIPAIFGLTRDPFLVFTANLFALLGLRHLYFLVGGLASRLAHLAAGLAAILAFIGIKLIAQALTETGVGRVGPVPVPHIGVGLSLAVIAGVLITVTVTSLLAGRRGLVTARAATQVATTTGQGAAARPDPTGPRPPP